MKIVDGLEIIDRCAHLYWQVTNFSKFVFISFSFWLESQRAMTNLEYSKLVLFIFRTPV